MKKMLGIYMHNITPYSYRKKEAENKQSRNQAK